MPRKLPFFALLLLRFCPSNASYEAIAGDLCEEYQAGGHSAGWFWRQIFSTVRLRWRPKPDWNDIRPASQCDNVPFSTELWTATNRTCRFWSEAWTVPAPCAP